jgi:hypothetical protein
MTKKKERRGRKALPPELKKPPQPTIKINTVLHPFVKLLKHEYKAGRVDADKLAALTQLLAGGASDADITGCDALTLVNDGGLDSDGG